MLTWDRIKAFLAPPVFEGDEDKTRTARLLNLILWANLAIWVLSLPAVFLAENPLAVIPILGFMILLGFGVLALLRLGHVQLAGGLLSLMLWSSVTGLLFVSGGVQSSMILGYATVIIVAAQLLGGRAAIAFAGLSMASATGLFLIELNGWLPRPLIPPAPMSAFLTFFGNIAVVAALLYIAIGSLNEALGRARRYATELESQRERLEEAVKERTRDLARRARYLEATTSVARDAATELDLQELLSRVVILISERFGFYHTGLFLLNPSGEWAELQAASSKGGRQMLARGHRLRVGQEGVVGHVAGQGEHRVALDVGEDAVYFDNPDLPETRSEMALPLQARGEIIGVLDVQSHEPQAFGEEDVAVLQTLADQVAVAISNARLFRQAEESAAVERRAFGQIAREAWHTLLSTQETDLGFVGDSHGIAPVGDLWEPQMKAAVQTGQTLTGNTLAIPIKVRDQVIGVVDGLKPQGAAWTREEIALLQAMTDQLSTALESARLYRDTQRRAARERLTGEVTARMRESLEMETTLETAASEIRQALGLDRVVVRLVATEAALDWDSTGSDSASGPSPVSAKK